MAIFGENKKKIIILVLIFVIVCAISLSAVIIKNATATTGNWDSYVSSTLNKDTDGYYKITTAEDFAKCNAYSGTYYKSSVKLRLYANIDMSAHYWNPRTFYGELDGNGFTIKNLHVGENSSKPTDESVGIFSTIDGANIHDVIISSATIYGYKFSGALAGYSKGSTIIQNVQCSGNYVYAFNNSDKSSSSYYCGGIVGYLYGGSITNGKVRSGACYSRNNDSNYTNATLYSGGVVGYAYSGTITKCYSIGTYIRAGYNSGTTYANSVYAGGIVGRSSINISSCFSQSAYIYGATSSSSSTVNNSYAGGIAGYCSAEINSCFNKSLVYSYAKEQEATSGSVTTKYSNAKAGGICGAGATVKNCYSTGSVTGGKQTKTYDVNFATTKQRGESRGSATWSSNHTEKVYGTITITSAKYCDDIQPSTTSFTNCYGTNSYFTDDAYFDLSSSYTCGGAYNTGENGTKNGTFSYKASNVGYLDVTKTGNTNGIAKAIVGTQNFHGTNLSWNYYQNIRVKIVYNSTSLKIDFLYDYQSGYLGGAQEKSEAILSDSGFNRTVKYTVKTVNELKNVNMGSSFATDSKINDGLPYIKEFYWKNNAVTPS